MAKCERCGMIDPMGYEVVWSDSADAHVCFDCDPETEDERSFDGELDDLEPKNT